MEVPKSNLAVVFAIALAAMIITAVTASLLPTQRIQSSGSVKALGIAVYGDPECTQNLTSINWGLVEAGKNYTWRIWVKNIGNIRVKLNMTTESWKPSEAKDYITLTWNKDEQVLNAGQLVDAILTLSVSASVVQANIQDFSFVIIIKGNEY